jgi:hypothetical protein
MIRAGLDPGSAMENDGGLAWQAPFVENWTRYNPR